LCLKIKKYHLYCKRLQKRIRIKDIANFCGVSPSLISGTLNNKVVAVGALSPIKEKKFSVPAPISVVSFGDIPLPGMMGTPLTSVKIPFIEIGQLACRTSIDQIRGTKALSEF
jgi:DNA-binding LacI/PurR family transcriptional regulator